MTNRPGAVDLLLVNANVLTMDPARPRARAVAVSGGRIRDLPADPAQGRAAQVVDRHGATLLPGFHDAHNHMTWFGMSLSEADLTAPAVSSLDELYRAIARRAENTPPGGWVVGGGYDQNKIGGHPHRDALDQAAPGRRVWLRHTSGHMCVVSSLVLADLSIDAGPADVPGGRVATDAAGRPTGLLEERANPAEAITAEEALRAYASGSAYASHQEGRKGSITPGKLADLVVLSEDPMAVDPARIAGLQVLATFVDGQCRYDAGALDGLP